MLKLNGVFDIKKVGAGIVAVLGIVGFVTYFNVIVSFIAACIAGAVFIGILGFVGSLAMELYNKEAKSEDNDVDR